MNRSNEFFVRASWQEWKSGVKIMKFSPHQVAKNAELKIVSGVDNVVSENLTGALPRFSFQDENTITVEFDGQIRRTQLPENYMYVLLKRLATEPQAFVSGSDLKATLRTVGETMGAGKAISNTLEELSLNGWTLSLPLIEKQKERTQRQYKLNAVITE